MEMMDKIEQPEQSVNFMDNAICLSLEVRCLGNRRKVASNAVSTPADVEFLHITKNLIDQHYMKELSSLHGELRAYVKNKCLPASSFFRRGTYLIPVVSVDKVDSKIEEFKVKQNELVDKLVSVYDAAKQDAAVRLGPLYNPSDYPSTDAVKATYSINTKYVAFSTPTKLKEISSTIFQREAKKAKESIALATDEIKNILRAGLLELTDRLVDKLSVKPDGSKKIFRNSLVNNVKEFLEDFNSRNIVDDKELASLVDKAKGYLDGVDTETLRDNDKFRDEVKANFSTIKESLDTMMIKAPARQFDFSEDE